MESKVSIDPKENEKNMKIAFHFLTTFLQSFSKIDRNRCMILWNPECVISGLSNITSEFSKQLMDHCATLAIIPEVEQNEWTEKTIKETLSLFKQFQVSNFTYQEGTGWANLKLNSDDLKENNMSNNEAMLCLKFVKRIERFGSIYLADNEQRCINGKHFVRTRLFTYHFLRPKKTHNQIKPKKPRKVIPKSPHKRTRKPKKTTDKVKQVDDVDNTDKVVNIDKIVSN
jgi:hypothetical protein